MVKVPPMKAKTGASAAALAKVRVVFVSSAVFLKSDNTTNLKFLEVPLEGNVVKDGYGREANWLVPLTTTLM